MNKKKDKVEPKKTQNKSVKKARISKIQKGCILHRRSIQHRSTKQKNTKADDAYQMQTAELV
jgi:hypothetical protein